jgi:hypothetical protein
LAAAVGKKPCQSTRMGRSKLTLPPLARLTMSAAMRASEIRGGEGASLFKPKQAEI